MALRQGASALRPLFAQHSQCSARLLPGFGSQLGKSGVAEQSVAESQTVAGASSQQARQLSSDGAAALAAKRAGLVGSGSPLPSLQAKGFSSFASAPAASSSAPAAAAGAANSQQPGLLRRLATAAAAVIGACMLATGTASCDSPERWQWLFQDSASSTAQAMQDLHHDVMFFVITITALVLYFLAQVATKFHYTRQLKPEKFTHHTTLEVIWTIVPTLIVLSIAIPSLTLIYSLDQHTDRPGLTVKVIGRQWYWSYEMHDHLQHKLVDPERLAAIAERSILKE